MATYVAKSKIITFGSLASVGVAISPVSMLGFLLGTNALGFQWAYIWIAIYALATLFLFVAAARRIGMNSLVMLSLVVASASVLIEQVFAFSVFPGLIKDIPAFGRDHLMRLAIMLCAAVAWYFLIATLSKKAIQAR
jgi:hypothetical protein